VAPFYCTCTDTALTPSVEQKTPLPTPSARTPLQRRSKAGHRADVALLHASSRQFSELVTACLRAALLSVAVDTPGKHVVPPCLTPSFTPAQVPALSSRCRSAINSSREAPAPPPRQRRDAPSCAVVTGTRATNDRPSAGAQCGLRPTSRFEPVWQWATHCCSRPRPVLC
jgi:hypothetical protein